MSDEQRKEEEPEVEAHRKPKFANDEPREEGTEDADFEAHRRTHSRPKWAN